MEKDILTPDKKVFIRSEYGPISFGLVLRGSVVEWSGRGARDLLISRCWEGVYLYPSRNLDDTELNAEPIKVFPSLVHPTLAIPADWNGDGLDDLIISDRRGFLYFAERRGEYPDLSFDFPGAIKDCDSGLAFNIPYDNPGHQLNDQNKYIEPQFHNYTYLLVYPEGEGGRLNLVIGDFSGNLWWLPEPGGRKGQTCL